MIEEVEKREASTSILTHKSNMRTTPEQKVIKLSELSKVKLTIPVYQRPYKWSEKNVIQLLEDIFEYVVVKNKEYRIGNIILNYDENEKKIML